MLNTVIAGVIGILGTLLGTIVTQITTLRISKSQMLQKENEFRRNRLDETYQKLIAVVNLFPNTSPNDILQHIEGAPGYREERFDTVLKILDIQLEDDHDQLKTPNITLKRKNEIQINISNRENGKEKIASIRDEYYKAKEAYSVFYKSEKSVFDLYSGQNVRNCLVQFEVAIHNLFIAAGFTGGDGINNVIEVCRRDLVTSMRDDLNMNV